MAWYALYKWFAPFRKTPYVNYITWYSNSLYNEWFNSLPEEDQKRIKEKEERKRREAWQGLTAMYATMDKLSGGRMNEIAERYSIASKLTVHPSKYW